MCAVRSFLLGSILSIFCVIVHANVPVLIWDLTRAPEKGNISPHQFGKIVKEILGDSMLVVFTERQLRTEDLTLCQFENGEKCYKYLESTKPVYYSSIEDPVQVLKDNSDNFDFLRLYNNGSLEFPITYETGKIVFIDFDNFESSILRTKQLVKHDDLIGKVYPGLSSLGKVVAMYSGEDESLSRRVRQAPNPPAPAANEETGKTRYFHIDGKFYIHYANLTLVEKKDGMVEPVGKDIDLQDATLINVANATYGIELKGKDHTIRFSVNVSEATGYWTFADLFFDNEMMHINGSTIIPRNFSYYCSNSTFGTRIKHLRWDKLQFQPSFNVSDSQFKFADAWHCVGFTSSVIWSGLFVVFMMLGIVAVGICWMLDINTMDRFDDPKGKTITVIASE